MHFIDLHLFYKTKKGVLIISANTQLDSWCIYVNKINKHAIIRIV
jgi:hypothetical protein